MRQKQANQEWKVIFKKIAFTFFVGVFAFLTVGQASAATSVGSTQHLGAWSTPAWEYTDGGPAFTNSSATADMKTLSQSVIRYQPLDCPNTIVNACGTDNHTGSLTPTMIQGIINGIVGTYGDVPFVQLPPTGRNAIGPLKDGTVMCPPTTDWSMNLASDKALMQTISKVYTGPVYVEQANEPEYNCAPKWGVTSSSAAFGTDNAKMYDATIPLLVKYMRTLGFTDIVTEAYPGWHIGTSQGTTCTASSTAYGGFVCTPNNTVLNAFNSQLHTAWKNHGNNADYVPFGETTHWYCHSGDNAAAPGSGSPYTFNDGLCQSEARQAAKTFHARMSAIWGSTLGPAIKIGASEWEPGVCNTSSCWGGWSNAATAGNAITAFQATLKDSGLGGNGYNIGILFGIPGGNACGAPDGNYDLVEICSGSVDEASYFGSVQNAFATAP